MQKSVAVRSEGLHTPQRACTHLMGSYPLVRSQGPTCASGRGKTVLSLTDSWEAKTASPILAAAVISKACILISKWPRIHGHKRGPWANVNKIRSVLLALLRMHGLLLAKKFALRSVGGPHSVRWRPTLSEREFSSWWPSDCLQHQKIWNKRSIQVLNNRIIELILILDAPQYSR